MPEIASDGHTVVSTEIDATAEEIFAVLADGYAYDDWVVGAKQIRHVDPDWPAVGSKFHHEIGVGPIDVRDSSKVLDADPPRRLLLEVRFRPAGVATVEMTMEPLDHGRTKVVMVETPECGPARSLALLTSMMLFVRNEWSLHRLKRLVTRQTATR